MTIEIVRPLQKELSPEEQYKPEFPSSDASSITTQQFQQLFKRPFSIRMVSPTTSFTDSNLPAIWRKEVVIGIEDWQELAGKYEEINDYSTIPLIEPDKTTRIVGHSSGHIYESYIFETLTGYNNGSKFEWDAKGDWYYSEEDYSNRAEGLVGNNVVLDKSTNTRYISAWSENTGEVVLVFDKINEEEHFNYR